MVYGLLNRFRAVVVLLPQGDRYQGVNEGKEEEPGCPQRAFCMFTILGFDTTRTFLFHFVAFD